jgi:Fe-S cluster assembly protein SufD
MNALAPAGWWQSGVQGFLARYDSHKGHLPGSAAPREAAAAALRRTGLPGPREEAWHYTNLRSLADTNFSAAPPADVTTLLDRLPAIDAPRVVFVNGTFHGEASQLPLGIAVRTGEPAFGSLARTDQKLVSLNTLLATDGAAIDVPAGTDGGTLLLISLGRGDHISFHPRHAVRLGAGATLTLIEIAMGEGAYLDNPVLSATVEPGAALTHLRLQDASHSSFHMSTVYADIAARGTYDSFALTLGARLARMEIHARLAGEKSAAHLNAAQLLGGRQHADFTTVVRHDAPATSSRQTVKNVLTGHARGVFQGKIEVDRLAQKTDGYQMNQALLLSPDAEIDCKPQLEIYADDVKCSHGATVGALDDAQLFYLRSRGIAEAEARSILVRAFLAEALDPIAHPEFRAAMETSIASWWERQPA